MPCEGVFPWPRLAAVIVLVTVYGNATQMISFGGGGFIGRFDWPVLPVLLAFAGLDLVDLWKMRSHATWYLAAIIALLCVVQIIPFVLDEHIYFNHFAGDRPATGMVGQR